MHDSSDSTDRRAEDYLLFALACLGFGAAAAGVVLSSVGLALTGTIVLLLALWAFLCQ